METTEDGMIEDDRLDGITDSMDISLPDEILIPLQSLVSCFLKLPTNRRVAVGTTEGLWRGYSSVCPKGTIC